MCAQQLFNDGYCASHRGLHSFLTTLFRSPDEGQVYKCRIALLDEGRKLEVRGFIGIPMKPRTSSLRSEEHTSELQSQFHIVCRLLLEKKKSQMLALKSVARSTASPVSMKA